RGDRLLAGLGSLTADLPDDLAARATHAAAWRYARQGEWGLAREAFLLLVDRYPAHPLTADAFRWLLRHNASSEARRRHERVQSPVTNEGEQGAARPAEGDAPRKPTTADVTTRTKETQVLFSDRGEARQWYQGALAFEPRLAALGPLFADDPTVQFPLQAAR